VPRTIVDLPSLLSLDELARAFHEASVRSRTTPAQVEAVINHRVPGAENLRRVLRGDAHVILSELERLFNNLLRGDGLDLPETNRPAGGRYVDCRWPQHKLTVELDSYRYHNTRHALGARPPAGARGLRSRRPVPALHLRRRDRAGGKRAHGAPSAPHSTGIPCRIVFSVTIRGSTNCSR
jgi:hypothetical protein